MASAIYEQIIQLSAQLSTEERQALIEYLQTQAKERQLTYEEWVTLFDSAKITAQVVWDFSPRREDWYNDEGR